MRIACDITVDRRLKATQERQVKTGPQPKARKTLRLHLLVDVADGTRELPAEEGLPRLLLHTLDEVEHNDGLTIPVHQILHEKCAPIRS